MPIQEVAVVGCGLMGSGIAEVCARSGFTTTVREVSDDLLQRGQARIGQSLAKAVERGKLTALDQRTILERLRFSTHLEEVSRADLIIEAIIEDSAAKKALYRELAPHLSASAILATNTSNISVTELAAATPHPERFAGLHFFNPVPVMKLVEVIRGMQTAPQVMEDLLAFCKRLGKHPIVAKDTCGFVVNVLLVPYLFDAIRLVENRVATIADIDQGMKLGCGHPMGPLELADFVGIDTTYHIAVNMFEEFKSDRYAAPPLLKRMYLAGLHGRKSGRGFYDYSDPKNPVPNEQLG
ncbi:MAG: 3-hydroxyacyl-CoA dehydrogenase family protein [Planctomycetota bacterium]